MSAPVLVRKWGEYKTEPKLAALRVLVDGQHVASVWRESDTWWARYSLGRPYSFRDGTTSGYATAEAAVKVALRRGLARQLGARTDSRVFWTDKARKAAAV